MFKFGDNKMIQSLKKVHHPVDIAGVSATLTTDVVAYDTSLLLSKEAMKKAITRIDFQQVKISILGKRVDIKFTSTGHYRIKLDNKLSDESDFKSNVFFCKYIYKLSLLKKQ